MPSEIRMVKLGDILPPEAMEPLSKLLAEDPTIAQLKAFCAKHAAYLEARGVLPDYLAWTLYSHLNTDAPTPRA